jgi:hypothetical protein
MTTVCYIWNPGPPVDVSPKVAVAPTCFQGLKARRLADGMITCSGRSHSTNAEESRFGKMLISIVALLSNMR